MDMREFETLHPGTGIKRVIEGDGRALRDVLRDANREPVAIYIVPGGGVVEPERCVDSVRTGFFHPYNRAV